MKTNRGLVLPWYQIALLRWSLSDRCLVMVLAMVGGAAAGYGFHEGGTTLDAAAALGAVITVSFGTLAQWFRGRITDRTFGTQRPAHGLKGYAAILLVTVGLLAIVLARATGTFPLPGIPLGIIAELIAYLCWFRISLHFRSAWAVEQVAQEALRRAAVDHYLLNSSHRQGPGISSV